MTPELTEGLYFSDEYTSMEAEQTVKGNPGKTVMHKLNSQVRSSVSSQDLQVIILNFA